MAYKQQIQGVDVQQTAPQGPPRPVLTNNVIVQPVSPSRFPVLTP